MKYVAYMYVYNYARTIFEGRDLVLIKLTVCYATQFEKNYELLFLFFYHCALNFGQA